MCDDPVAQADHDRALQAAAWDEGFMYAAEQDHPAYPRTRRYINPYVHPGEKGSGSGS